MTSTEKTALGGIDFSRFVYIREVRQDELAALPAEALQSVDDVSDLVVVTNGEGEKLAIIEGHATAVAAAEAYKLQAISVH